MHLIDCNAMMVVQATDSVRWIALSYVWGEEETALETDTDTDIDTPGLTLPIIIPQTVRDAITVTKRLGYQFLWVDEWCIDSRDQSHQMDQIGKMDEIYRGADLTIVAAAGKDKYYGLPGVSVTKRTKDPAVHLKNATVFRIGEDPWYGIRNASWYKRAWTFQEGYLSKGLLVFTDQQASFFCKTASWMEGVGGPGLINANAINWSRWPVCLDLFRESASSRFNLQNNPQWIQYFEMVQLYTERTLTLESDILNAFFGIMAHFLQSNPPLYNISGLPYFLCNEDDTFHAVELVMFFALSWTLDRRDMGRRRHGFPSWTWAGWEGASVAHESSFGYNIHKSHHLGMHKVHFATSSGNLLQPSTLPLWDSGNQLQHTLDQITGVQSQALEIPADCWPIYAFFFSGCHHISQVHTFSTSSNGMWLVDLGRASCWERMTTSLWLSDSCWSSNGRTAKLRNESMVSTCICAR